MAEPFYKTRISLETGVPVAMLTCGSAKACEMQAKEFLYLAQQAKAPAFPSLSDSGEVSGLPDMRSTSEIFAEWAGDFFAFDPRRR